MTHALANCPKVEGVVETADSLTKLGLQDEVPGNTVTELLCSLSPRFVRSGIATMRPLAEFGLNTDLAERIEGLMKEDVGGLLSLLAELRILVDFRLWHDPVLLSLREIDGDYSTVFLIGPGNIATPKVDRKLVGWLLRLTKLVARLEVRYVTTNFKLNDFIIRSNKVRFPSPEPDERKAFLHTPAAQR